MKTRNETDFPPVRCPRFAGWYPSVVVVVEPVLTLEGIYPTHLEVKTRNALCWPVSGPRWRRLFSQLYSPSNQRLGGHTISP